MLGLGTTELILIVAVLFLLFGASRLPQLAKSLGQSRKAFKEGMKEAEDDFEDEEEEKRRFSKPRAPQLSALSDDELLEEARRRAAVRRD
ncbi:MAG: twin-arginine translocase TatA/TatE family subunit [Pyrinomonadaceae bacterium]